MRAKIRSVLRRWLRIEGQQAQAWKHAVTSNSFAGKTVAKARIPTPPSELGNWELVSVILRGYEYTFWWKARAEEGQQRGPFYDQPIPASEQSPNRRPLQHHDPDLVQYDRIPPETLSEKFNRYYAAAGYKAKGQ
jgi:hypothetical protein